MIVPFVVGGYVTPEHVNQSLPGLVARMLTAAPSFSVYLGHDYVPLRYDNIADIGPAAAALIVKVVMGLFALLVVWCCRAPVAQPGQPKAEVRRGWRLAAEYSVVCIGMLLFSERTWKHHCVTLLLPGAVMCYGMAMAEWSRLNRRLIGGCIVAATAVMLSTSTGLYYENQNRMADQAAATGWAIGPTGLLAATQAGIYTSSPAKLAQAHGRGLVSGRLRS